MAKLTRVPQKVFGSTGGVGEFGAFGSDALGIPTTTKNLETIQSLAPYNQGLFAATNNANEPPRIQDINGLYLLFSSQLAYMFQNGVPEWHAGQDYYAVISYCQKGGVIYRSVTGTDGSPNVNNDPATDDGTNWESGEASFRSLKFDLDRKGFTGYALYTDAYLPSKLRIAERGFIGKVEVSTVAQTPVAFSAARSSANPSAAEYNPIIPLHDANHDITTAEVPQAVIDVLNSNKVVVKDGSGVNVSSFSGTLASGVVTLANNTENNNFLDVLQEAGLVNRWYGTGEIGLWAAAGALYTGARQYSITIAGSNYAVSAVDRISRTITLATYPADGAVTIEMYPHRIGGYTDRSRLRRVSGEAMVAGGDISSEVAIGLARMHRVLSHGHRNTGHSGAGGAGNYKTFWASGEAQGADDTSIGQPIAAPTTSLVTGKTNDVRSFGVGVYLHVGTLLATTWTSVA